MKLHSFPAGLNFLHTLARYVIQNHADTPESLARVRIYLPHHRACRTLTQYVMESLPGGAGLLPQILPLGEAEAETLSGDVPPVISAARRQLLLASMLHQKRNLALDHALRLATSLLRLQDEVQREEAQLETLAYYPLEERFAAHWQEARDILLLLARQWPEAVAATGCMEPIARRNLLLRKLCARWHENIPQTPIIIAGSTGSQPAVRRLMQTVLTMPKGEIILPALDATLSAVAWHTLPPTHPQWGLKQLLEALGVERQHVFAPPSPNDKPPSATTITAHHLQEEAEIIARLTKQHLLSARTVLIVTQHTGLVARLQAALQRFGIPLASSTAGLLAHTEGGTLLRLLAQLLAQPQSITALLAVLKHPFVAHTPERLAAITLLERHHLRGRVVTQWHHWLENTPLPEEMLSWLKAIAAILQRWLSHSKTATFASLFALHHTTAEEISEGRLTADCPALAHFLSESALQGESLTFLATHTYPAFFDQLLCQQTDDSVPAAHPQVQWLTPMEARLHQAEVMILAGLNEGCWPAMPGDDPWLNAAMRARIGLAPSAHTVGQQAQDFYSLLASGTIVYLTRAAKEEGTATTPSRWWQLLAMEGRLHDMSAQWQHWLHLSREPAQITPLAAPLPCPPVAVRPHRRAQGLSISDVTLWQRDPYALYAKHTLRLSPLEPLDENVSEADFGDTVHRALEAYHHAYATLMPEHRLAFLMAQGERHLRRLAGSNATLYYWLPCYRRLAEQFLLWDEPRRSHQLWAEVAGHYHLPYGDRSFLLRGRADRIEQQEPQQLTLVDYKTGSLPSATDLRSLKTPQLPLEALIAAKGGWVGIQAATAITLEYWSLRGREDSEQKIFADGSTLAEKAEIFLAGLLESYENPSTPYLPSPDAKKPEDAYDYAHLERLKEWRF